jgi:SAM-dependent methyltransferase
MKHPTMHPPLYDSIGQTYRTTRHADPTILNRLASLLGIRNDGVYLDLACGTGNYTVELAALGGSWHGVDISRTLLDQAAARSTEVEWQQGSADALPYESGSFDGVVCSLAIHHFPDLVKPFREVERVLAEGRFVLFTAFPQQMRNYWLCEYFPEMMERACDYMPDERAIQDALSAAGLEIEEIVPYEVSDDLEDLFLYAGKRRPHLYLDPDVRANISSFATQCTAAELERGLERLRSDLGSGGFQQVIDRYDSRDGDYAFVVVRKIGVNR